MIQAALTIAEILLYIYKSPPELEKQHSSFILIFPQSILYGYAKYCSNNCRLLEALVIK